MKNVERLLKNVKTTIAALAVCAVALTASVGTTFAAGNTEDVGVTFNFSNSAIKTTARVKNNDSSVYMKCTSITAGKSYTGHVVAKKTVYSNLYVDKDSGHVYLFRNGSEHRMINCAMEDGYPWVAIEATPNYSSKFYAKGVWSPDSVR